MGEIAGDPADRTSQRQVRHDGEQEGEEQGLPGVEGPEHPPLVDRIHAEAEKDQARAVAKRPSRRRSPRSAGSRSMARR